MLQNEREYVVTKKKLAMLAESLAEAERNPNPDQLPVFRQAGLNGIRFLMEDLEEELAEFERLRDGQVCSLRLKSVLSDLPSALARARVARGWTQRDLARALGTTEQQVQEDEHGGYEKASLSRLYRVADALGMRLSGWARLAVGEQPSASSGRSLRSRRRVVIHRKHPTEHSGGGSLERPPVPAGCSAAPPPDTGGTDKGRLKQEVIST